MTVKTISNPPKGNFRTRAEAQAGGVLAAKASGIAIEEAEMCGVACAGAFDIGFADGRAGKPKASRRRGKIEWGSELHAFECGYAMGAGTA